MKLHDVQTNVDAQGNIIRGFHGEEAVVFPRIIVLSFIRHIFSNIKNANYKYNKDVSISKIKIEDSSNFDFEKINLWPAITVSRSNITFSNMFIGDRGPHNDRQLLGNVFDLKAHSGADIITGTLSVNVYAMNAYEAEILIWLIAIMMKIGESTLRESGFHNIYPEQVSPPMVVGSESTIYMTTLSIKYALSIEWFKNKILDNIFNGCVKIDFDFNMNEDLGECEPGQPQKENEGGN